MPHDDGKSPRTSPSPKDLVMAGLAACTSMTLQTRARTMIESGKMERGSFKRIDVHAYDSTPQGKHMPTRVNLKICVTGSLSAAQRRQLLAAADMCPVKQMLKGKVEEGIEVEVVVEEETGTS
ncbi:hypothetical protein GUITHDRAFT_99049 [Guillardia theta CCMP2712]|uniref:OsmC-like protein n=1 Tax=Guillardia theta (strain CCMP2712) TaxID=905079 RepID=L1K4L3_GUITC|nr:hypothetical protein GUITHDRAFT_99049 [Guillardia theta CCMP2712]EKX55268.1 hypothetical protein GUITHDRAFT_99049 [Guillardia theta CCMP2712]|mmetsp:Transcript_23963/g.77910  ORF Transcript_23963/g.77910 Transcript_23963/m.77910 type:complete len:123 (+) Transcript_23963:345-713(+)|eukprot:XP_005842248.1 hypothetical protein GUITHDRAFT_99049 [Guillardia theta CCMP2712]